MIYLAIGPLSFFFQAVYTESLFLLLSLACFVFAREGRWRLAGVMGLLATLTRSTGVLLLIPLAYYYYERRGWKLRKTDSHVANLLMVVEGLLVWMTYLALAFGKPLAFSTAQAQWERGIGAPNYTVTRAIVATVYGLRKIVSAEYYRLFWEVPRPGSEYSTLGTNIFNLLFLDRRRAAPVVRGAAPARRVLLVRAGGARVPALLPEQVRAADVVPALHAHGLPAVRGPRAVHARPPAAAQGGGGRGVLLLIAFTAKFAVFSWVA